MTNITSATDPVEVIETIDKILGVHIFIARTITQANTVESIIDAYIANYYTRCPNGDYQGQYLAFRYDILASRNITLSTKIDILFKALKRIDPSNATKTYRKKYITWLEIRNKFAHGNFVDDENGGKLFYGGEFLDAKKLADKFMGYQRQILAHLDTYGGLRGPYFNHFPTKKWENQK